MNKDNLKISIIITVHNNDRDIESCLQSVINQTYTNLEIIVIDDGSTDKSLEICERYKKEDPRIRLYQQKQSGISQARNMGIQISSSQYLMFVDGDDTIAPEMTEKLFQQLLKDNSDIICGNTYRIDNNGTFYFFIDKNDPFQQQLTGVYKPLNWVSSMENTVFTFPMPWGKIYKKKLFNNIEYPVGKIAEDNLTTWKIFLQANSVSYLNSDYYCWRLRTGSITESPSINEPYLSIINNEAIQERIQFYSLLGIDTEFLRDKYTGYLTKALSYTKTADNEYLEKNASVKLSIINKYRKNL